MKTKTLKPALGLLLGLLFIPVLPGDYDYDYSNKTKAEIGDEINQLYDAVWPLEWDANGLLSSKMLLESQNDELQGYIDNANAELADLWQQYDSKSAELATAQSSLQTKDDRLAEIEQAIGTLEYEIMACENSIDGATQSSYTLESDVEFWNNYAMGALADAEYWYDMFVYGVGDTTTLQYVLSQYENAMSAYYYFESEVTAAQDALDAIENDIAENTALLSELEGELADLEQEQSSLEQDVSDLEDQLLECADWIELLNANIDDLETLISEKEALIAANNIAIEELQFELNGLYDDIALKWDLLEYLLELYDLME
jgi:chromosome segregation ATPase